MNTRKYKEDAYNHELPMYSKVAGPTGEANGKHVGTTPNAVPEGVGMNELVNEVITASQLHAEVRRHYNIIAVSSTDEVRQFPDSHARRFMRSVGRACEGVRETACGP